jgi:hypothetical protein
MNVGANQRQKRLLVSKTDNVKLARRNLAIAIILSVVYVWGKHFKESRHLGGSALSSMSYHKVK